MVVTKIWKREGLPRLNEQKEGAPGRGVHVQYRYRKCASLSIMPIDDQIVVLLNSIKSNHEAANPAYSPWHIKAQTACVPCVTLCCLPPACCMSETLLSLSPWKGMELSTTSGAMRTKACGPWPISWLSTVALGIQRSAARPWQVARPAILK